MSELKTRPTDANVEAFLSTVVDEQRRRDAQALLPIFTEICGEPAQMWGASIVGFGQYRYRNASGRGGEWMLTGFSPRKQNLTLYIMPGFDDVAPLLEKLGPHKLGKSCLYIKRLEDVDLGILRQLIARGIDIMRQRYPEPPC